MPESLGKNLPLLTRTFCEVMCAQPHISSLYRKPATGDPQKRILVAEIKGFSNPLKFPGVQPGPRGPILLSHFSPLLPLPSLHHYCFPHLMTAASRHCIYYPPHLSLNYLSAPTKRTPSHHTCQPAQGCV